MVEVNVKKLGTCGAHMDLMINLMISHGFHGDLTGICNQQCFFCLSENGDSSEWPVEKNIPSELGSTLFIESVSDKPI